MKTEYAEFAPLEMGRAEELRDVINKAARDREAIIIGPNERGITGSTRADESLGSRQRGGALRMVAAGVIVAAVVALVVLFR